VAEFNPQNKGSIGTTGFDDLFKQMDNLAQEIGKGKTDAIWRKAMDYAFSPVYDRAKSNASMHVDTGQMLNHLYMKVQRPQARDKSSLSYRGEMFMARVTLNPKREDSQVKTTLNKGGKFKTVWNHPPVGLALEFGTAEMAARPFLRPALDSNIQNVQDRLGVSVWDAISKIAKKKG
jgi:HK97 gp10 family phage protein